MATLLYRLGTFGAERWRTMLIGWLLTLGAVAGLGISFAGTFQDSNSIPGSSAEVALTKMDRHWPEPAGTGGQIVFQAPSGHRLTEPGLQKSLASSLDATSRVDGVIGVSSPAEGGEVSKDERTAVAPILFDSELDGDAPQATLEAVKNAGAEARGAGLKTVYGGEAYAPQTSPFGPTEMIGLGVALAALVITFGSLLAAGLPLITAILGVVGTMVAMMGLASAFNVSDNAPTLAIMLGLAVGIDYALFIVSRHRAQLADGTPVRKSIAKATATAGSAVVFAGATVVIALAGLSVAGVPMLTSMGLASAGSVSVAVLMALTLLPALMSMAGHRLIPKPRSRAARQAGRSSVTATLGVRWTQGVLRHPLRNLILGTVALIALAIPAMQLKLALTDEGSNATTTSSRQAYDIISDAFGPGANGPLVILIEDDDPATIQSTATAVENKLNDTEGIADTSGVDVAESKKAARIQVIPTTGPRTQETSDLVSQLRTKMQPIARAHGSYVAVTGLTAVSIDVSSKLGGALVPFAIVVIGLSLLLLMVAFRSIAIPVKATVGFLLSLGAAFGATVAVFQWGWLSGLLGVPSQGPVASFVPIIVMAVLFGLAMDYEVFLVSAIREDYVHRHDARAAIIVGARNAARVVTSAAVIMISVFISFLFSHDIDIMPIAFALAFGVLIDAFLVRMTLVPAVLALLGDRAWWLPRRLDRVLPHLDVEGENLDAPDAIGATGKEPHHSEPIPR
ncbi:MMPL family transporter [Streptomyces sp. Qhu-G9]|uniref:MMPL family transporter n=1 Tax=Streptomyces sp. Qhu-G9 TaxID=3452799 RepID=UPI0022AC43FF|nr:MMPL family transporter [Streptomyces aurantiacus]WAU82550.1 MMPL family transporter [Streptomyces aurantiacus]